ncbi:hypothetical protein GCM10011575_32490 [Microlunatus endophyticus]|uniref:N-acetyltransferase domain-containing protein n=1 Tax=Microlunatus endophyticus TaxID=1716077 RepID=A0A917SC73_9ACTN|nr:hypothetical protein GCM10011575_32490 [Microlunatus endophyticus]
MLLQTVDPDAPAAVATVARYFAELNERLPGGFDAMGPGYGSGAAELRPPNGAFVVGLVDGQPAACGGVRTIGDGIGEIKRMWIDPQRRGLGLGSRLLAHLEALSAGLNHRIVRLDTNDNLTEALRLYRRRGYREIEPYNDNPYARCWFEKQL